MSRRTKIIIIASSAVFILLIIFLLWLFSGDSIEPTVIEEPPVVGGTLPRIGNSAVVSEVPEVFTKEPASQSTLVATAITFAERYGSFSTDSDLQNFSDLKHFMTKNMMSTTEDYISQNITNNTRSFYGVTTKALSTKIIRLEEDETSAQVLVSTQRQETTDTTQGRVLYQNFMLSFLKDGDKWVVDSAQWQ